MDLIKLGGKVMLTVDLVYHSIMYVLCYILNRDQTNFWVEPLGMNG